MTAITRPAPDLLAEDWDDDDQNADETQLVTFRVGDEEFGVHIMKVQEILRMGAIHRLPAAPPHVEGIMALRGSILLVMDLRKRLNLPPRERSAKSRIVVLAEEGRTLGIIVDSISSVQRIPNTSIRPAGEIAAILRDSHVAGVASLEKRLIIVLETDRLLSDQEMLPGLDPQVLNAVALGTAK